MDYAEMRVNGKKGKQNERVRRLFSNTFTCDYLNTMVGKLTGERGVGEESMGFPFGLILN